MAKYNKVKQKNRTSSLNLRSGAIKKKNQVQLHYNTRSQKTKIEDLSVEIMQKIFAHLPVEDLYKNVRSVCYRWRSIASSPCLWTNIKVGPNISTNELSNWLDLAPNLKNLEMYSRCDAGIMLRKIAKCNNEIEHLNVRNCWGSAQKLRVPSLPLCQILTRCPRLTYISLRGSKFSSCKFFQLLFTRDTLMSKRALKRKRKNARLIFRGVFRANQLRAFIKAKLESRIGKTTTLTFEDEYPYVFMYLRKLGFANITNREIERIIDAIFV